MVTAKKDVTTFALHGQNSMKIFAIAAAAIALLVGVGAILPALAHVRDQGMLPATYVGSYTLGIILVTITVTSGIWSALQKHRHV